MSNFLHYHLKYNYMICAEGSEFSRTHSFKNANRLIKFGGNLSLSPFKQINISSLMHRIREINHRFIDKAHISETYIQYAFMLNKL